MSIQENFMQRIAEGDQEIYDILYQKTLPKVSSFVLKNKGNQADAEDVFQKGLMQIALRYMNEKLEVSGNVEAFVFTVCKNLWRRELNNKKTVNREEYFFDNAKADEDICTAALEQERWELLQRARKSIIGNCKAILDLYFEKASSNTIMKKMGYASEIVVRQRIFKCKKKLISMVKEDSQYDELKNI